MNSVQNIRFKPNKAGLFKGGFFWGGGCQFELPFIFQEELIYQYNFVAFF